MWYVGTRNSSRPVVCYAESDDGVHWEKTGTNPNRNSIPGGPGLNFGIFASGSQTAIPSSRTREAPMKSLNSRCRRGTSLPFCRKRGKTGVLQNSWRVRGSGSFSRFRTPTCILSGRVRLEIQSAKGDTHVHQQCYCVRTGR